MEDGSDADPRSRWGWVFRKHEGIRLRIAFDGHDGDGNPVRYELWQEDMSEPEPPQPPCFPVQGFRQIPSRLFPSILSDGLSFGW